MTQYVVLARESADGFEEIGRVESTTDLGAIKKALDGATQATGEFVAVPARSWRPRKVKAETKTQLTIT